MPTIRPKFATKDGFLTSYSHACGYLDVADIGTDKEAITMGFDCMYFVRVAPGKDRERVWDCFEHTGQGRKDARRRFLQLIREHKATRRLNKEHD